MRSILVWVLWAVLVFGAAQEIRSKRILYIDSYHAEFPWSQRVHSGITMRLADRSDVELYVVHMDTKRNPDALRIADIEAILKTQLSNRQFDGVIVSDDNAYRFALKEAFGLFADMPVVFCGINDFDPQQIADKPHFTGLAEVITPKETLQTALALQPELREFVVIGSTKTLAERINLELIKQTEPLFPAQSYRYLTDLDTQSLKKALDTLGRGSVVVLTGIIQNPDGRALSFEERTAFVREHSRVPLYSFWDHNLGLGIVGGRLVSARGHGFNAAGILLEVLSGRAPQEVDLQIYPANRFMFDYHEMTRFDLPLSALPAGSHLINAPKGWRAFVVDHLFEVMAAVASGVALVLLWALIVQIRSRRKVAAIADRLQREVDRRQEAEAELAAINQDLHRRVEEQVSKTRQQEQMLIQQSKMAMMGEMIAAIAHQWKQPLNTIGLIVQEIADRCEYGEMDVADVKRAEEQVMAQIAFMAQTISDFKNFLKPSKENKRFDVRLSVDEVIRLFSSQFRKHRIEIAVDAPDAEYPAVGYPNEFKQALLNLFSNAKEAILDKQQSRSDLGGKIEVVLSREGGHIRLVVRDNGGGIPDALLKTLFDPYVTSKGENGTGIGLYMTRMIIQDNLKGEIRAANTQEGAEFTLVLPLAL